ncbi:MAG: GNAT family N-acetyltransferase [Defluviitaleaceae bacterium]|nr:GNAT family N-acetyltransferase [Defluviitaleaceae bacterium]MCL2239309.1 GNAT family N-acetyltransferase [Defluviitaleaceae bacterium]
MVEYTTAEGFDTTGIILETERLLLRPFTPDDLADFYAYARVPGVGEAAGWPHHESIKTSENILKIFLNDKNNFALYHKADKKVIGSFGVKESWTDKHDDYKHLKAYEIGYVLSQAYWGQGLVPEATRAVIDYLFNVIKLDAISICHFRENDRSRRVIEKCGFSFIMEDKYFSKQLNKEFNDLKYLLFPAERYTEVNAQHIDRWVAEGWIWGQPVSPAVCEKARRGEWDVLLTPTRPVPKAWFPPFKGAKILGLASGGGQQMPIFSLLGGHCTVMDLSDAQLESEKTVARREGYEIEIIKADMTRPFPFPDESFDFIFHPVSNCYIEDVHHVWRECHRVLKPGGVLLSGLDNGINYLFDTDEAGKPLLVTQSLPFNPLKNPAQMALLIKEDSAIQFSHTFDEQIGGQLRAGFILTGAYEDYNHDPEEKFATAEAGIPAFWATRAVKG